MKKSNRIDRNVIKSEIRKATMEIIGKEGFQGVTARKIGEYMGLRNVSLVNYYFGSKEELILETLKRNYFDVMSEVYYTMEGFNSPREKLSSLFEKMMEIFMNYPALISLFYFDEIRRSGCIDPEYIEELMTLQKEIAKRNRAILGEVAGIRNNHETLLMLYQLRGAMMFPPLAQGSEPELKAYFSNYKNRKKYIDSLVDKICLGK